MKFSQNNKSQVFLDTTFKFDHVIHHEVTEEEIRDFQEQWKIPILKVCNNTGRKLADGSLDGRAGIMEVAPILNAIVEVLWKHCENEKRKFGQQKPTKKRQTTSRTSTKFAQHDHQITDI